MNGKSFSYEYDALGKRYQKTVDGKITKQYWSGNDLVAEERIEGTSTTVLIYLYDWTGVCGMKRLREKSDGSVQTDTYWYKKNELGDIAEIYGVNGKLCEYRYDAWGNYRLIDSGTGMDVTKDQVIGGISTNVSVHIGHINPFRYRGYYYDEETGFYYLNTRYYDPEIRRFINMDNPELVAQLAQTPGQLNLYAYCNNNPVAFTDESGEGFVTLLIAALVTGLICGAFNAAVANFTGQNVGLAFLGGFVNGFLSGFFAGLAASLFVNEAIKFGAAAAIAFAGGFWGGRLQNIIATGGFNGVENILYGVCYGLWNIIGVFGATIGSIMELDSIIVAQLWNILVSGTVSAVQGVIDYTTYRAFHSDNNQMNGGLAFYKVEVA